MSLYPYFAPAQHRIAVAAAALALDGPFLPLPAEPPCACGHERLYHNDRWDAGTVSLAIAAGPCTQCVCGIYREPDLAGDIAAVGAGMRPEYDWSEVA